MANSTILSDSDVQHIAKLANLPVDKEKIAALTTELSQTTAYIDILQQLDTSAVSPTFEINHKKNVFRPDEITPSLSQSEALSQSGDTYQGFFKTAATIKK